MVLAEDTGQGKYEAGHHAEEVELIEDAEPAFLRLFHGIGSTNGLDEFPIMR